MRKIRRCVFYISIYYNILLARDPIHTHTHTCTAYIKMSVHPHRWKHTYSLRFSCPFSLLLNIISIFLERCCILHNMRNFVFVVAFGRVCGDDSDTIRYNCKKLYISVFLFLAKINKTLFSFHTYRVRERERVCATIRNIHCVFGFSASVWCWVLGLVVCLVVFSLFLLPRRFMLSVIAEIFSFLKHETDDDSNEMISFCSRNHYCETISHSLIHIRPCDVSSSIYF